MKTFVIGDIHGRYDALLQCLQGSLFDYDKDCLIALGDVCDRHLGVKDCFDELMKIKNLKYIIGNHDLWTLDWGKTGDADGLWVSQGGAETIESFGGKMPKKYIIFLDKAFSYIELDGNLFVHGGFDSSKPVKDQNIDVLCWDRKLVYQAHDKHQTDPDFCFGEYEEIFVGHTTTQNFESDDPLNFCNLWMLDTGVAWDGFLTLMNVETKEYWQSGKQS